MCSSLDGSQKRAIVENRRHRAPRDVLAARLDQPLQQLVEPQHPPQAPRQPHVAEVAQPLQANAAQLDQQRFVVRWLIAPRRIEQRELRPLGLRCAAQMRTQLGPAVLLAVAQFAQIRHDPLPRAFGRAIRLDQGPIRMRLAVLPSLKPSEKHERSFTRDGSSPVRIAQLERCQEVGLHYIAFRRLTLHRPWTYARFSIKNSENRPPTL